MKMISPGEASQHEKPDCYEKIVKVGLTQYGHKLIERMHGLATFLLQSQTLNGREDCFGRFASVSNQRIRSDSFDSKIASEDRRFARNLSLKGTVLRTAYTAWLNPNHQVYISDFSAIGVLNLSKKLCRCNQKTVMFSPTDIMILVR